MIQIDDTMYARLFLFFIVPRSFVLDSCSGWWKCLLRKSETELGRNVFQTRSNYIRAWDDSKIISNPPHHVSSGYDTRIVYVRVVKFAKSSAHLPESNSTIRKVVERRANRVTKRH